MKKFLRKVGLLTAAVMMMSSGAAYGNDAEPLNKWTKDFTSTNIGSANRFKDPADVSEVGTTNWDVTVGPGTTGIQKINKNQKVFWALDESLGTDAKFGVNQSGTRVDCTAGGGSSVFVSSECVSAPLKIAAPGGATICLIADIDDPTTNPGALRIQINACADDTCTEKLSTQFGEPLQALGDSAAGSDGCGPTAASTAWTGRALSGQIIYLAVSLGSGQAVFNPLIWVVGK